MFSTWGNTQEVGWVRHAFDQFEIPFDLIFKERIAGGNLRSDYDVILVPNQGRTGKGLVFDVDPRVAPLAYTKTDRYQFLGDYGSSEDITGGIGIEGVLEFQRFVDAGGLLVTLGTASYFRLYPDFPKSTNTLYLYILRAKLSVRPAQVDGIYVNIISHGSTPARTRACSDTTPRPDALYRALSRLDAVSDQAHVNVTHCQI